jgi:hypothetical protein
MVSEGDSPKPKPKPKPTVTSTEDVLFAYAPTADGEGARVLRKREERIETGELRPMKEGKPIVGEVVKLKAREGQPQLHDVEVLAKVDAEQGGGAPHKGPAQVATEEYRASWDRVFGAKDVKALN